MFLPKSCWLSGRAASSSSARFEHVRAEDIDAHRRQRRVRRPGHRRGLLRLLLEPDDALAFVDADDAEARRVGDRHLDGREGGVGVLLLMEPQHLRVVHLVHVVARQDDDVARGLAGDRIEVLIHGVRGAEYQCSPTRFCGGRISMNSPSSSDTTLHPMRMCRFSESDLYCVAM